jgi:hypothetical protein
MFSIQTSLIGNGWSISVSLLQEGFDVRISDKMNVELFLIVMR